VIQIERHHVSARLACHAPRAIKARSTADAVSERKRRGLDGAEHGTMLPVVMAAGHPQAETFFQTLV